MLHTHDEFLTAIAAQPADRTLRLVYADWLDEHTDPRGALIRAEEEMREVPVFADRFWELKPRRNELRSHAGPEWCGKMRYGTECEPVFRHGIPDGWRERWRLIREFTERWRRIPMSDVGGRHAEITKAETRLGRKLPPSVREWIAFAHDLNPPEADWLHVFGNPYQMEDIPAHEALSLLLQPEGDYHWAVQHQESDQADPRVWRYHYDYENENYDAFVLDERNPNANSVTDFVLGYAMECLPGITEGGFGVDVGEPSQLRRELATIFPPPAIYGNLELHELDNVLVILSPAYRGDGLHLRVEVANLLPGRQPPAFLRSYAQGRGMFHGMYHPEERRRHLNQPTQPNTDPNGDDPILF